MTTRRKGGTSPRMRREIRPFSAFWRSPRTAQQTQPFPSSKVLSATSCNRWWSSPISPNSLTRTAVSERQGSRSNLRSRVVLPLPRKPVTILIGVRAAYSAISPLLQGGEELVLERIADPSAQALRLRPELAEIVDDRRAAGMARQHIGISRPVGQAQPVMPQDRVEEAQPVLSLTQPRVGSGAGGESRGRVGAVAPMPVTGDDATQGAHRPFPFTRRAPLRTCFRAASGGGNRRRSRRRCRISRRHVRRDIRTSARASAGLAVARRHPGGWSW